MQSDASSSEKADDATVERQLILANVETRLSNGRQLMTLFFQWLAFFWTMNLGALAWMYGNNVIPPPEATVAVRVHVAYFFIFQNTFAIGVSIASFWQIRRIFADIKGLYKQLTAKTNPAVAKLLNSPSLRWWYLLGVFGFAVASNLAMALVWYMRLL